MKVEIFLYYCHGEVEAIDEADGVGREVGVAVVEAELGEGGTTSAIALDAAIVVAGGVGEMVVVVSTAGSGPNATKPVDGGGREGAVGEGVEGEAAPLEDGVSRVWMNGWIEGEGAVVDYC